MENSIVKEKGRKTVQKKVSEKPVRNITDEDIRQRAYEIYKERGYTSHSELDGWFRAESELKGIII
jgi:hypothetical protein